MRLLACLFFIIIFSSCWKLRLNPLTPIDPVNIKTVWGSKPIYGVDTIAKKIIYINQPQPVIMAGNIYVKDNFIFQADNGKGLHVIDNSNPAAARRIGFITINGCSQISIKGSTLYSNSYDDLVVVDISDVNNIKETGRIKGAFPEGRTFYTYIQPTESGYFECPRYDSVVIGWRKDSVKAGCYKN